MTALSPLFNQALGLDTAAALRALNSAYFGGRAYEAIAPGAGAIGRGHGVLSPGAMRVTAQPTPNNTINISSGFAAIRGSTSNSQGSYICPLETSDTLTVAAKHATLTRVDWVVAKILDAAFAGVENEWELQMVAGTPGSGAPAVPEDCLVLAQVTIAPGGDGITVISGSSIQDLRVQTTVTGGITPVSSTAAFPNPKDNDVIWDISTSSLLMYASGVWLTIGRDLDANWITYAPNLTGMVTLGTGGSSYGRYARFGKTVVGICGFELGTGGVINVSLPLAIGLPSTAANPGGTNLRYMAFCRAFLGTNGLTATFWSATGLIVPNTNTVGFFATAGTVPWIGPSTPANWHAGVAHMRVLFNYEEP